MCSHQGCGPQQKRTCKIMQDCARMILHARLSWHVHAICPFSCTILAQSCTYLARNGARFCKRCCKNNYLGFLHINFFARLARIGARLCKNRARKGTYRVHVPSKSCMQDSCTILHDLASLFLLGQHVGHVNRSPQCVVIKDVVSM